ncbi:hypothetical protein HGRIS_014854 [Hohenbuehelia grisea]
MHNPAPQLDCLNEAALSTDSSTPTLVQYMFSSLEMPKLNRRLTGDDMRDYMNDFVQKRLVRFKGCRSPYVPDYLSAEVSQLTRFKGLVLHSQQLRAQLDDILARVRPLAPESLPKEAGRIVVGGAKSAQDMAAYLANEGRHVAMAFDVADNAVAGKTPLPDSIRRSRFLGIISPHIELRTRLE